MGSMLSFDVSAIDVVLLVVMVVLLLLFLEQRGRSKAEPRMNTRDHEELLAKPYETEETSVKKSAEKLSAQVFQKCVHQFGHLRNMPKNTPVPDECFGCPRVLRCMFPNE